MARHVNGEIAKFNNVADFVFRPAQAGANARDQLFGLKRLIHVVIRAGFKP